jgi:hypothetical protein
MTGAIEELPESRSAKRKIARAWWVSEQGAMIK